MRLLGRSVHSLAELLRFDLALKVEQSASPGRAKLVAFQAAQLIINQAQWRHSEGVASVGVATQCKRELCKVELARERYLEPKGVSTESQLDTRRAAYQKWVAQGDGSALQAQDA